MRMIQGCLDAENRRCGHPCLHEFPGQGVTVEFLQQLHQSFPQRAAIR